VTAGRRAVLSAVAWAVPRALATVGPTVGQWAAAKAGGKAPGWAAAKAVAWVASRAAPRAGMWAVEMAAWSALPSARKQAEMMAATKDMLTVVT
jgi:hypothetical protein